MITPSVTYSITKNHAIGKHLSKHAGIQYLFPSFYNTLYLHINSLSFLRPLYFEGVNGYSIVSRKGKQWESIEPHGKQGNL